MFDKIFEVKQNIDVNIVFFKFYKNTMTTATLSISNNAVKQVKHLLSKEKDTTSMLRVIVNGGGCAGFQYHFKFDHELHKDDVVFEKDGVKLVIDDVSLNILDGSEVDYVDELIGSAFQIKNPNAKSTCGCGTSFSL